MHSPVDSVDAIRERKLSTGPAIVVLQCQLDLDIVHLANSTHRASLQLIAILVQIAHKRDQAPFKIEGRFTVTALVSQADRQTTVQVGHLAETLRQNIKAVIARLHNSKVG